MYLIIDRSSTNRPSEWNDTGYCAALGWWQKCEGCSGARSLIIYVTLILIYIKSKSNYNVTNNFNLFFHGDFTKTSHNFLQKKCGLFLFVIISNPSRAVKAQMMFNPLSV